jgi:hypothetical protein
MSFDVTTYCPHDPNFAVFNLRSINTALDFLKIWVKLEIGDQISATTDNWNDSLIAFSVLRTFGQVTKSIQNPKMLVVSKTE